MSLATDDDLANRLGRALTDDELASSEAILAEVSGAVILYTGQKFIRDDWTWRTRVKRGIVRLPQRPVHSVDSVTDIDGNDIAYTWDGLDRVHVNALSGSFQINGTTRIDQVVDVTYDAGPDEVPTDIVGVVVAISLRTLGLDPMEGAVTSESIDGYSYRIGAAGGAGSYGVLPAEASILDHFKGASKIGTIRVAW